jgi:hypothetical protein
MRSKVLRLTAELSTGSDSQALEWWTATLDGLIEDLETGRELDRATLARVRFARVHGLVWGPAIIDTLDAESEEFSEVGETLFADIDEDQFEDLREFRSTLAIIDSIQAAELTHGSDALRALGRALDDSMFVLKQESLPWLDTAGEPIGDELRLRGISKAYLRAGFARHDVAGGLLILAHAEHLAALDGEELTPPHRPYE